MAPRRRSYSASRRSYGRPVKTVKYSNETSQLRSVFLTDTGSVANPMNQAVVAIPPADIQGLRKAKNFTLRLQYQIRGSFNQPNVAPIYWALVYVPEGQTAQNINIAGSQSVGQDPMAPVSFYEPNQNVIMSGVITPDQPVQTNRTRLARNLNSGDTIQLVYHWFTNGNGASGTTDVVERQVVANLNYAITL